MKAFRRFQENRRQKKKQREQQNQAARQTTQHVEDENKLYNQGRVVRPEVNEEELLQNLGENFKSLPDEFSSQNHLFQDVLDEKEEIEEFDKWQIDFLETLEGHSQKYKGMQMAAERKFRSSLLDNAREFIDGMQRIQDVKIDLRLTALLAKNSRTTIQEVKKNLVENNMSLLRKHQRRMRYLQTTQVCETINWLRRREETFSEILEAGEFLDAIEVHREITLYLERYSNLKCLDKMRMRFRGGNAVITSKLREQLRSCLESREEVKFRSVCTAYQQLNEFESINELLQEIVSEALEQISSKTVSKHLKFSKNFPAEKAKGHFKKLCKGLQTDAFMKCFLDVSGRVFDVLYTFYRLEEFLTVFKTENELEISNDEKQMLRKNIWHKAQNLLADLLDSSQIKSRSSSKMKMEDLLKSLHAAQVFMSIGKAFCGSESTELSVSVLTKCEQYLQHFKRSFYEMMLSTFGTESWIVCPLPKNFSIETMAEFKPNTEMMNDIMSVIEVDEQDKENNGLLLDDSKEKETPTMKPNDVGRATLRPAVYQQFLRGVNVFDKIMNRQDENGAENGRDPFTSWQDGLSSSQLHYRSAAISKPRDDGTEPVITAASLNLAKHMGKCLQIMECLPPVCTKAFDSLCDAFLTYLYHVFIWFGVGSHMFFEPSRHQNRFASAFDRLGGAPDSSRGDDYSHQRSVASRKYPKLTQVINDVAFNISQGNCASELAELVRLKAKQEKTWRLSHPPNLPDYATCLLEINGAIELHSWESLNGAAARFVAAETLPFLCDILAHVRDRVIHVLPEDYHHKADLVIRDARKCVDEIRTYMYRNVPTLLVSLGDDNESGSIKYRVVHTNWNIRDIPNEASDYVQNLVQLFQRIEHVLSGHEHLPTFIHHSLNTEAIIYVLEQLVLAYSKAKKCSNNGRAQIRVDQNEFQKCLRQLRNTEPLPSWEYMDQFINMYYLSQDELIAFIESEKHKTLYDDHVYESILRTGRTAENLSGLLSQAARKTFHDQVLETVRRKREVQAGQ